MRTSVRRLHRTLAGSLLLSTSVCVVGVPRSDSEPIELNVVIDDSSPWHTHPPGDFFTVDVHVEGDDSTGAILVCQWFDARRRPISPPYPVTRSPRTIQSPSTEPGYYGLVFYSLDPDVAFLPQPAGLPSQMHGFAVIPDPPAGTPEVDETSPFGLVQAHIEDPYLRWGSGTRVTGVHLKTKTWKQGVTSWGSNIAERVAAGHTEMPLIDNDPWETDDHQPITIAQLQLIGDRFRNLMEAEPNLVEYWQAGLEENGGQPYLDPYYFLNLGHKIHRLRFEADRVNPDVKFLYSTRGDDMSEFERLFISNPFRTDYDGLAHNPYRWPDFPSPEGWLVSHIDDIRTRMNAAGHTDHLLWFGELGIPVRGHNDPNAFFGYPDSGAEIPGASPDYAALYLVKCHALAIAAGVQRIYVYNYKNRGDRIHYAEDHFGLRAFSEPDEDPGHPMPAYVAYINMLAHLKGTEFVTHRQPILGAHVFEFAVTGTAQRRILAWVHPEGTVTVPLASLSSGLHAAAVESVTDLYGSPVPAIGGQQITLDGRPIYLRF